MDHTRTMLKVGVREKNLSLSTCSRACHPSSEFLLPEKKLIELEQERYVVARDTDSYITLSLYSGPDGEELLSLKFSWLNREENGRLSGQEVEFQVSYKKFKDTIRKSFGCSGEYQKILSLTEQGRPQIEFHCHKNLKEAVGNPHIRRKLGHFLGKNFLWPRSKTIHFYDDFEPYSFGFSKERTAGYGMCGAVILHGKGNEKEACYRIYT